MKHNFYIPEKYQHTPQDQRLLIGIAGIPGSGKTTLATKTAYGFNDRCSKALPSASSHPEAIMVPMDGYHLTRAQLDAMPDPQTARARRGAAFTFDGSGFLTLVKELRKPITGESKTLYAPSFDHAVKDPVENAIPIPAATRVLVFEGNYIALDEEPWREARGMLDVCWFVEVSESVARERLIQRHVVTGVANDEHEAGRRADENDLVNGREIVEKRLSVDEVIKSIEDEEWKEERRGAIGMKK